MDKIPKNRVSLNVPLSPRPVTCKLAPYFQGVGARLKEAWIHLVSGCMSIVASCGRQGAKLPQIKEQI